MLIHYPSLSYIHCIILHHLMDLCLEIHLLSLDLSFLLNANSNDTYVTLTF